jgi:hypothetical protein
MNLNFAFVCLLLFSSCSQQRLAFRFADTAASWKADDYFDITSEQKNAVKIHLKLFLKKAYENNNQEIPKIFEHADQILSTVNDQNKIDCREIEKITIQSSKIFSDAIKLSSNDIQALIQTLNKKQIQYFIDQVAKKSEADENLKKISEREDQRLTRNLDNLKLFLGSLSAEQESALRTHIKNNPFPSVEKLKNNTVNFEKLKLANSTPENFQKFFVNYIQNWRDYQSITYLKLSDDLRRQNEIFYQNFICQASVKQLKHLRQKLSEIKKDFEEFFIQKDHKESI